MRRFCVCSILVTVIGCSNGLLPLGRRGLLSFAGIKSTQAEPDSVRLLWDRVDEVSAYVAYRIENGTVEELGTVAETASVYAVSGLSKNTTYTFRVQARDMNGNLDGNANDVSVTTPATIDTEGLPETASGDFLAHWRASTGVTLHSGAQVSRWADQSGNGYDLINSPGNSDPELVEGIFNGLPALCFQAIPLENNDLTYSGAGRSFTLLTAVRPIVNNFGSSYLSTFLANNGLSQVNLGIYFNGSGLAPAYVIEGSTQTSDLIVEESLFYVLTHMCSEANGDFGCTMFKNGTAGSVGNLDFTNNNVDPGVSVGTDSTDCIAEMILYDRLLLMKERQEAEAYLGDRYSVSIEN